MTHPIMKNSENLISTNLVNIINANYELNASNI